MNITADARPVDEAAETGSVGSRRLDYGRLVMVPVSVLLGGLAVIRVATELRRETGAEEDLFTFVTAVSTGVILALFYTVIVWAYLRRGPAEATSRSPFALAAAPVATFLPFALPFAGAGGAPAVMVVVGELLLICGLAFSVWSLRCLDRSLSVVPQARALVQHGPYSRVRHPLYLGELVAMLGLAMTLGGVGPLAIWLALVCLQAFRAVQEEKLLASFLPDYPAYQARTSRIVPGVF